MSSGATGMRRHYLITRKQSIATLALNLVFGLVVSGCGSSQVSGVGVSQAVTPTNTGDFVVIWELWGTPTPTPYRPPYTPVAQTAQPTVTLSALSAPSAANQLNGPAAQGQIIFTGIGTCVTCHDTSSGVKIGWPSLKGVASRAASREPGKSADDYLHESIMTPNAYVVQGFSPVIMPQNFAHILSKQQINHVVSYLQTLKSI